MNLIPTHARGNAPHRLTVHPAAHDFRVPAKPMAAPTTPARHWPWLLRQIGRQLQGVGSTGWAVAPARS